MSFTRPFAAGLLLIAAQVPLPAQAQTASAPTLPGQCRLIENRADGVLVAECQGTEGLRASAIHPAECRTGLSMRSGVLACTGTIALEGPLRGAGSTEGRIGDLLATVLGTTRPGSIDTSWSEGFLPASARRMAPETRIAEALAARTLSTANAATLRREHQSLIALETRHAADGRYTLAEYSELENATTALNERIDGMLSAAPAPAATGWQTLASRRADFDSRRLQAIDAGAITSAESARLRTDWQALETLETSYSQNGLDARERADLESRLNGLETRLGRFGKPLAAAAVSVAGAADWAALETRIAGGEGNRTLNRMQSERLRTELEDLRRLDDAWRRLGRNRLTAEQQAYLDRRHGELSGRIDQALRTR